MLQKEKKRTAYIYIYIYICVCVCIAEMHTVHYKLHISISITYNTTQIQKGSRYAKPIDSNNLA